MRTTRILLMAVTSVTVLAGYGCTTDDTVSINTNNANTGQAMVDDKMENSNTDKMMDEDEMLNTNEAEEVVDAMESKTSGYAAYNADQVTAAATNGTALLFFHAPWCPTCHALNANIEANLADIPTGVTIFKTDYDTETELKKKYGVTYQHTLVQVDAEGNLIQKWSGGNTLQAIISHL